MIPVFDTGVYLHAPRSHLLVFPTDDPPTLSPPSECDIWSLKCPFNIDPAFYSAALEYKVPIAFAVGYFSTVAVVNQINRRRGYKPYWISKTRVFWFLTVLHNTALAVYSAVTFAAMVRMVYMFWPGWFGKHGVVGAVDSLCKLHGPRGYGDAVTYNQTTDSWSAKNSLIHLDQSSLYPDDSDVGRIWNEGLAWWGFWFYLSKFYEVLDTVIILSKGKRSSTLQTYHHTGAMFCMWAGIRFMAAPIYMFVLINSFIHTLMYTFYTVTCFGVRVPARLKRLITTLQIMQLITGVFYASAHFMVSYDVPVTKTFKIAPALSSPESASSVASSLIADATQAAQRAGDLPSWVKRLAYRAAGAEALAESVHDGQIYTDRQAAEKRWHAHNSTEAEQKEHEQRTYIETVDCLDTSGQGFATWLNVAYLIPLAFLFIRFFVKSYLRKGREDAKKPRKARGSFDEARRWSESAKEAARETADAVECLGENAEEAIDDEIEAVEDKINAAKNSDTAKNVKAKAKEVKNTASKEVNEKVEAIKNSDASEAVSDATDKLSKKARRALKAAQENTEQGVKDAKDKAGKAVDASNLEDSYVEVKDEASKKVDAAGKKVDEVTGNRSAGDVVEEQNTKIEPKSEGEWMKSPTKGSKLPVKAKDKNTVGEPKDILNPKPGNKPSGEDISYAEAVKEDLAPGDHGAQPPLPPKVEGKK